MKAVVAAGVLLAAGRAGAQSSPPWAAAIDSMMLRELARTGTPGAQIAVVERGRVAYTKGYGVADVETRRPVTASTLFQVGSVTKLYTATLVARLAVEGRLDLRAPISRWVTELEGRQVGASTLHELLTHSAGWSDAATPYGRTDDAALGDVWRAVGDSMLLPVLRGAFSYSNPGLNMAGYVAERAVGRPYAVLVDSLVLRPLGMTRATQRPMVAMTREIALSHTGPPWSPRPSAVPAAASAPAAVVRPMPWNAADAPSGFLFVTAQETARLAAAFVNGGTLDGAPVLPAEAIRLVTGAYVPVPGTRFDHEGYGMHTDSVAGRRLWQKEGTVAGYHALVTMWPGDRFAVVVYANRVGDLPGAATALAARIVAGVAPPPPATYTEREPTAAERAALVGTYRIGRRSLTIREGAAALELVRPTFAGPIRMTGRDAFTVTSPNGSAVDFLVVRDSAGGVRYLHSQSRSFPRVP